jgi:8-oxo-dGTP diphosphatase
VSVVLLRLASAGERTDWTSADHARPLDAKGRRQAERLVEELRGLGVRRAVSSPYVRCVQTVEPLGLPVEYDDRLAEGAATDAARTLLDSLEDAVACTHGDVILSLLGRKLKKGAYLVWRA